MENKHTQYVDFSNPNADKITTGVTNKPMINKKQTAVEWLVEQIDNPHTLYWLKEFIEQAKAMEKEQIETAWHNGNLLGRNGWVEEEYNTGSQYYKQTYGCNK